MLLHLGVLLIPLAKIEIFASSYINKARSLLFLLMMLTAVFTGAQNKMKSQRRFIYIEILLLAVCWIRAYVGDMLNGLKWDDSLEKMLIYLYPMLMLPLVNLFCTRGWKFENCARLIIAATTADTLLKMFMSFYESVSGTLLWPNIVSGEMGYRNGLYRINPAGFSILVIPLAFWLMTKAEKLPERILYLSVIGIDLLYAFVIWQARSALLYKSILLVMLFFFQRTTDKRRIVRFLILIAAIIIFINTPTFNNFVDSFSESNAEYGDNTMYRRYALQYFISLYEEQPFFGVGLLDYLQRRYRLGGTLEDVGFLYSIVQLGIPMVAFYITMFSRCVYVALAKLRKRPDERLLLLSITFMYLIFGINIDTFYMYGLTVPFYIAMVEYFNWLAYREDRRLLPRIGVYAPREKDPAHENTARELPGAV